MTGEPDAPPARFGLSIVDYMAGLTMAFSLVSGVLSARDSGIGRDIDVSLFDNNNNLSSIISFSISYNADITAGVNGLR